MCPLGFLHIFLIVLAIQLNKSSSVSIPKPDAFKKWSHQMILGAGMEVKWDGEDRNYLTMEMSAPTRGYLGVGFSPSGGMAGADIVFAWIDSRGVPFIMDLHGVSQGPPIPDEQQDYELIAAEETKNKTTITFRRHWDTCDEKYDMKIGNDTVRMIWAYHCDDPGTQLFRHPNYHGAITRGVRSTYMRTRFRLTRFPDDQVVEDQNILTWDVSVKNVQIRGKKTKYMCKIVKFPRPDTKHHMIGYRPMLTPGNVENIHHISVSFCQLPNSVDILQSYESYLKMPEQECYSQSTPQDWIHYCSTFLFAWGIGSEGQMLPSHIGIPLGPSEQTYFKIEVHYDNPAKRNFIDSSGIRIFYTEDLREYDASILFLGQRVTPFHMIPEFQKNFKTIGFCSKECTEQGISFPSGIKIISVLLHGHLAARSVRLRHVRNAKELPPIAEDYAYDFKYQQFRTLSNEIIVFPGDELIVECNYDTTDRDEPTFGGFATKEEMCKALVMYYPRTSISDCRSQPELYSFFNALGIENVTGELLIKMDLPYDHPLDKNVVENVELLPADNSFILIEGNGYESANPFDFLQITNPIQLSGVSVGDFMRKMNWKDEKMTRRLEKAWKNENHYMFCSQPGHLRIPVENRIVPSPTFEKYQEEKREECQSVGYSDKSRSSPKYGMLNIRPCVVLVVLYLLLNFY